MSSTSSEELDRQPVRTTAQPLDSDPMSRPSTSQWRHLMPVSPPPTSLPVSPPPTSFAESVISCAKRQQNPLEWFTKFHQNESRQPGPWKFHHLKTLEEQLQIPGSEERGDLKKIVTGLSRR